MSAESYRRARDLFVRAIELEASARESFVASACGADTNLRADLASLLAAHDLEHGFDSVAPDPAEASKSPPPLPESIGRYRILGLLGEGGMGIAYLAEQDHPRRRVALKVLHAGVVAPGRIQRFEREAQILARLHHPGIAQVFDAGNADLFGSPRPFLAMELVSGRPLCEHADAHELGHRARLALLIAICHAVQHAHEKGVIHRDLKPANILVDEHGQPKVLDFGIARATADDLAARTLLTRAGEVLGTLPYMSPEQLDGDPEKVDARADVYALGVIGYELLAGRLPLEVVGKSLPEIARAIRDDDPPLLGTLVRALRGDVETIFAKALEKERERRYASARDLAADLERCLAEQPIAARPPSTIYQLSKFARRNRLLVGGVGAVLVTLVLGIVGTASQAARAGRERDDAVLAREQAKQEAREAEASLGFLKEILSSVDVDLAGRDARMLDVVNDAARGLPGRFAGLPRIEASLWSTLGAAYSSLGSSAESESSLRRAVELYERVEGPNSQKTLAARCDLASELVDVRKLDEAETMVNVVLDRLRAAQSLDELDLVRPETVLARIERGRGRIEEAAALLERGLERRTRRLGADDSATVDSMVSLASVRFGQVRQPEAIELLESARQAQLRRGESTTSRTLMIVNNLAATKRAMGDRSGARSLYETLDATVEAKFGTGDFRTLMTRCALGVIVLEDGDPACASEILGPAVADARRYLGDEHDVTIALIESLSGALGNQGRMTEAVKWTELQVDILSRSRGATATPTISARCSLANGYRGLGRADEAELQFVELLDRCATEPPTESWLKPWIQNCYGALVLAQSSRLDEAESLLIQGALGMQSTLGPGDWRRVESIHNLVRLYDVRGNAEKAAYYRRMLLPAR